MESFNFTWIIFNCRCRIRPDPQRPWPNVPVSQRNSEPNCMTRRPAPHKEHSLRRWNTSQTGKRCRRHYCYLGPQHSFQANPLDRLRPWDNTGKWTRDQWKRRNIRAATPLGWSPDMRLLQCIRDRFGSGPGNNQEDNGSSLLTLHLQP
jgi:hypothetical protein